MTEVKSYSLLGENVVVHYKNGELQFVSLPKGSEMIWDVTKRAIPFFENELTTQYKLIENGQSCT
jgi:hypothetical protein